MISKQRFRDVIVYNIILKSNNIDSDSTACTGNQLTMIISSLKNVLKDYLWYIADIEYNYYNINSFDDSKEKLPTPKIKPLLIGNSEKLIEYLKNVDQFMSGVFLAVNNIDTKIKWPQDIIFDTENPTPYLEQAEIDIRAIDTSFFEIFTSNEQIMDQLNKSFVKNT